MGLPFHRIRSDVKRWPLRLVAAYLLIILMGPCPVTVFTCLGTRFIMGSKHVDGPISIRELATDIEGSLDTIGSGNCLLVNRVNYVSILVSFYLNSIIINGHDSQIFVNCFAMEINKSR